MNPIFSTINNESMKTHFNEQENKSKTLEKFVEDLAQYERMLESMTKANLNPTFKKEVGAVDNWFQALEEGERTAALYALIHKCSPVLVRFFITVSQKLAKTQSQEQDLIQGLPTFGDYSRTFGSVPMLKHSSSESSSSSNSSNNSSNSSPTDVPTLLPEDWRSVRSFNRPDNHSPIVRKFKVAGLEIKATTNWGQRDFNSRPKSAVFQETNVWKSKSKLVNQAAKSLSLPPGLQSPSALAFPESPSPVEKTLDPVDFKLLEDIPQWMRSLRLHKYTSLFINMNWKEVVVLNEDQLTSLGVAALGARRKFLKIFDHVKKEAKKIGIEIKYPVSDNNIVSDDSNEDLSGVLSLSV